MSINKVILSGNLTRDPELRKTQGGMSVLQFGIAVNERRKNQQTGEWEDVPNFFDCTMFGNRAESLSQHLSKGTKAAICGKLRWSQWEQDGQKRSKVGVIVEDLEFMSQRNQQQQQFQQPPMQPPQQYQQPQYQQQPQQYQQQGSVYDEDIPF